MRLGLALLALLAPAAVQAAPPIVVSAGPDQVDIALYRDPARAVDENLTFDPADEDAVLAGYALVNEVRTVELPPGEVTVRFEGVAGGIVPQSAILFDTALKEKNFDARLLSQRGLIDAFTGQRVAVRRTDPATGKVTHEAGTIISHPDRLLLRTAAGIEAVQCEGNFNTLLFPGVPVDLTAKPTLSLTTRPDSKGGRLTLRLAYLAGNFDWQANYVGTFAPDGQSLRLMAWMTLANGDQTSFVGARTSGVAGTVFREGLSWEEKDAAEELRRADPYAPDNIEISAGCWPQGRTAAGGGLSPPTMAPAGIPLQLRMSYGNAGVGGGGCDEDGECDSIIVTGSRIKRFELSDLKLYSIAHPTTLAARSIKQVRLLSEHTVKGETLFRARYRGTYLSDLELLFRFRNRKADGLGEPLPKGQLALFQQTRAGRQLLGETSIEDRAEDEEVELKLPDGDSYGIDVDDEELDSGDNWTRQQITLENGNSWPVTIEVELRDTDSARLSQFSQRLPRREGAYLWRVELPAGAKRKLVFHSTEVPEPDPVDESDDE